MAEKNQQFGQPTSYKVRYFIPIYLQANLDAHNQIVGDLLAESYYMQSTTWLLSTVYQPYKLSFFFFEWLNDSNL